MDLQQTIEAVMAVIQEPTSNLTAFALIAAAVVLAALILILTAIMWLVAPLVSGDEEEGDERGGEDAEEEDITSTAAAAKISTEYSPARVESPLARWGWIGVTTALFVTAFVSAYAVTSTDQFCLDACHSSLVEEVAQISAHDGTDCIACHEDPLPGALLTNTISRVVHTLQQGSSGGIGAKSSVSPTRCERCHENLRDEVLVINELAIQISHAEPLEAGMSCPDCHRVSVHGIPSSGVEMATCLPCHDSETASSECGTCHTSDPANSVRSSSRIMIREVLLPRVDDCGGCHDETTCDACHGLRLPHSRDFLEGSHAMQAAFDRKPLCWRCHTEDSCGKCHGDFGAHGGLAFKTEHQTLAPGSPCTTCHQAHEGSFCAVCHGEGR